jgi:cell division protein FtsB
MALSCLTRRVNVERDIWSELTKIVVGLIVLAVLLLIGMCYLPLIQENTRMRAQILKLDQQLETETNQLSQLQAQIDALRNDPKTVERLAREKLGYALPGETIIRFEPATNAAGR